MGAPLIFLGLGHFTDVYFNVLRTSNMKVRNCHLFSANKEVSNDPGNDITEILLIIHLPRFPRRVVQ